MAPKTDRKKLFFKYSEQDLKDAVRDVQTGNLKLREASRKYNVPHSTLINKLKSTTLERKMGPSTILTKDEEELICKWIFANAKKGIPINKKTLMLTVGEIINNDKRKNPFKNGVPGEKWFSLFLKRHPDISQRHAEAINAARATVTEEDIRKWHKEIYDHLKEQNALSILDDPARILNSDETGFETNPKTGLVLGPKGMKNFYEIKSGSEKDSITVLCTIAANGDLYPPMIVYPYERIPMEIARSTESSWALGRSKKGWMISQTFFSYICNTLLPLLKEKNVSFPVLYLVDGHRSHLTYNVSKFCSENGIILFALFPNATHILQPADVSVFRPLKNNWRNVVIEWKRNNNNKAITKIVFSSVLQKALEQLSADTVRNGFRKCGLFPFNVEAIDFTKCMSDSSRKPLNSDIVKPADFKAEHLLYVESAMKSGRAEEFRKNKDIEWTGDVEAKELFYVWKKLRGKCENSNNVRTNPSPEHVTGEDGDQVVFERSHMDDSYDSRIINTSKNLNITPPEQIMNKSVNSMEDCNPENKEANSHRASVSSSFLDHILWPTETPDKSSKQRTRERLPHATTSKRWLEYWEQKENEKRTKELEKKTTSRGKKEKT